jgi:amidohydrolase
MPLTTACVTPQLSPDVLSLKDELVALRRDFHQHPELGFEEVRTSAVVASYLESIGLQPRRGIAKTGLTADIVGDLPGPTILLRADMDALPITEETGLEFASRNPGKMHACGHDGHTAILLTTAKLLTQRRAQLRGTVRVLFQPAEEGPGGAEPMIAEGVLDGVQAALGLHLWLSLATGHVNFCPGPMLAATDEFDLKVIGLGTHAASPHEGVDPITTASHIVTAAQTMMTRALDPKQPVVLTITRFHAGTAYNVIPAYAELGGTLRTYNETVRKGTKESFERLVRGTAAAHGASAEISWREGYPVLVNDPVITGLVESVCRRMLQVAPLEQRPDARSMGGEDMAFYLQKVPGCFFFLGAYNENVEACYSHHHPRFTIDEEALPLGVELLLACVDRLADHFLSP